MKALLSVYGRENSALLGFLAVAAAAGAAGFEVAGLLARLLALVVVYRLNVEIKTRKSWEYMQSLPLPLGQRALLHLWLPGLLVLAVFLVTADRSPLALLAAKGVWRALPQAAGVVAASVLARSTAGFVGYVSIALVAGAVAGGSPVTGCLMTAMALALGWHVFNGRRFERAKLAFVAVVGGLVLGFGAAAARTGAMRLALARGGVETQILAARHLAGAGDRAAYSRLQGLLRAELSDGQLEDVLDALDDVAGDVGDDDDEDRDAAAEGPGGAVGPAESGGLAAEEWLALAAAHPRVLEAVFEHWRDRRVDRTWLTAAHLERLAPLAVAGESRCRDACEVFARLSVKVARRSPAGALSGLLARHLAADSGAAVEYALMVILKTPVQDLLPAVEERIKTLDGDLRRSYEGRTGRSGITIEEDGDSLRIRLGDLQDGLSADEKARIRGLIDRLAEHDIHIQLD